MNSKAFPGNHSLQLYFMVYIFILQFTTIFYSLHLCFLRTATLSLSHLLLYLSTYSIEHVQFPLGNSRPSDEVFQIHYNVFPEIPVTPGDILEQLQDSGYPRV